MRRPAGRAALAGAAVLATVALAAAPVRAATIVIQNVDQPGQGFNDATPVSPVGGNDGTTLGAQRMNVFKKVAQLWGDALESVPQIVVSASFAPLACTANQIMLGQAAYSGSRANTPGAPPGVWLPIALANALAGMDLNGATEEIDAMFNGGLSDCSMGLQNWYYGLDGQAGDDIDLLAVVLHEFGHGLGFASVIDPSNGVAPYGMIDVFTQHVYDNATKKAWGDMTDAERGISAMNARHLVWDGPNVMRQMGQILALGSPTMAATPGVSGLTGHVSESEFGPHLSDGPVTGPLKFGKIAAPCTLSGSVSGGIVLFPQSSLCPPVQQAYLAQKMGAIGVMFEDPVGADPPYTVNVLPSVQDYGPVTIPVVSLSTHDTDALMLTAVGNTSTTIDLGAMVDQRVGADEMGRTDLFASNPVLGASTLSHWDPLARPDLMMEPQIADKATHDQRMELAAFRDMGWHTVCGNGTMDPGEACDLGDQNGAAGSTCNADCTMASGGGTGTGGGPATGSGGSGAGGGGGVTGSTGSGGVVGTGGASAGSTGGSTGLPTGGTNGSGGTQGSGGVVGGGGAVAAGSGGSAGPAETGSGGKGCSCETAGGGGAPRGLSLLAFAGLVALRRRRRA